MNTSKIRKLFLDYFSQRGHTLVPSSSLVPSQDPSLLFTTAGMVQFKKVFLEQEVRPYQRATSCQKCLRAGGKHNDLENVGFTSRHHTFFEMLGNFSFGDYFKEQAIEYAWDFITNNLKIPKEKLWVTVYQDDNQAADIWLNKIKIDPNRFSRCDAEENFWSMGDTGPCGPCSEIYYDHGADFTGSPPGFGDPGDRYVEIYNLVFMQYNRLANGQLEDLPKPCVDTGMGLERVASVMQSLHNNYHIDLFASLIKDISKLLGTNDLDDPSLKIIADHLRAGCFLVTDGVLPGNEGRGYVMRRIMRRAIRYGYKLGRKQPFMHLLVNSLVNVMGQDYPELPQQQAKIEQVLLTEEVQFAKTLDNGMRLLQQQIEVIKQQKNSNNIITGEVIFKLYDTYGFPMDLTMDIAKEQKLELDLARFNQCMLEQQTRARGSNKFKDISLQLDNKDLTATEFIGYDDNETQVAIENILVGTNNQSAQYVETGQEAKIILATTPFYAESGGQIGDSGELLTTAGDKFVVIDTQKSVDTIIHIGKLETGRIQVGDLVTAKIDFDKREAIKLNHSATHLLHAALRYVLGEHVKQKGSIVDQNRLRFDFEHSKPLTQEQLLAIELQVNLKVRANIPTQIKIMSVQEAIDQGAIALFDDKYQDQVRVLDIADGFSVELCGGTHVESSGDIGYFKILSQEAIASGVRRIEAITGDAAIKYSLENQNILTDIGKLLKVANNDEIIQQINKILQKSKSLEKSLELVEKQNSLLQVDKLLSQVKDFRLANNNIKVLATKVNINPKYLKAAIDRLKQLLNTGVIILGCEFEGKAALIVGVTKNLLENQNWPINQKISAIDLIKEMSTIIDGKGGGRADLSEARGNNVQQLSTAIQVGYDRIVESIYSLEG
jgi:alanyl-tRNA synthetase